MAGAAAVDGGDDVGTFARLRSWFGAHGRPGTPRLDLVPLAAFLHHDLTEDEILDVATDLTRHSDARGTTISDEDIRAGIAERVFVDASAEDIAAVRTVLDATSRPSPDLA